MRLVLAFVISLAFVSASVLFAAQQPQKTGANQKAANARSGAGAQQAGQSKPKSTGDNRLAPAPSATSTAPAPKKPAAPEAPRPLATVLTDSGDATTFGDMLKKANLLKTLDTAGAPGPYTVFVPSDGAFSKIPKAEIDALMADDAKLAHFIKGLVYKGSLRVVDMYLLKDVKMLNGDTRTFSVKEYKTYLDSAKIVKENMPYAGGMVQEVDEVLMAKSEPPKPKVDEKPAAAPAPAAAAKAPAAAGKTPVGKDADAKGTPAAAPVGKDAAKPAPAKPAPGKSPGFTMPGQD
jgi:uncharacterized surface protein with fasciclin (FAS1) repeats